MVEEQKEQKNRGCFYYGCLTLSILTVVALVFSGIGIYFAYQNVTSKVDSIAENAPSDLRTESHSPEEQERLRSKIAAFAEATAAQRPIEPLTLDAKDINSLIQSEEKLLPLKDHLKIEIDGDEIKASISLPLAVFKRPEQYFNGTATVKFVDGEKGTQIFVSSLHSKGGQIPEVVMSLIRNTDLLSEMRKSAESREIIDQLDRIQVKNGYLILYGKGATPS